MSASGVERCWSFISAQLAANHNARNSTDSSNRIRAVTISRQAGCGAHAIAARLAEYLAAAGPKSAGPWMVMDRELVETVLHDHNMPDRLAKFMPEDRISEIEDIMDDVLGLHPASEILVRKTAETILHLAEIGNVILIGRGANVVTAGMDHVFHVRLVGSFERRLDRVQQFNHLDRKSAADFIHREDRGRKRYLRKYYGKNIDDPLLYHVVTNTDFVPDEKLAQMIASCASNPAMHGCDSVARR
jgi:cytidylate kinase